MKYYRHNWYHVGGILFVALAFLLGFRGSSFSTIQLILILSFMAMLAHQVEEYAYPGGFPTVSNTIMFGEKAHPDRYPLNANQCMISNVFLTYPFYILAICFPGMIWLGLAQIGLGLFQTLAHVVVIPIKQRRLYNPGFATNVLLFWPIGAWYIWYVVTNNLATTEDFILGGIGVFAAALVLFLLPIILLRNKESKYPFSEAEMTRGARGAGRSSS
ncbi:MAG TPA: HXXEE domain-containing protein [Gemmatimonadales bacterium]|jgi:hypothetical protein